MLAISSLVYLILLIYPTIGHHSVRNNTNFQKPFSKRLIFHSTFLTRKFFSFESYFLTFLKHLPKTSLKKTKNDNSYKTKKKIAVTVESNVIFLSVIKML